MWILVVCREALAERPEGGAVVLRQLGCRVEAVDLWDPLDQAWESPPTTIVVEALDEVDAGRAALVRLRAVSSVAEVPILLAVTVDALTRMDPAHGFDDFVLVPYVPQELYRRIRQAEWKRSDFSAQELLKVGSMVIDLAAHEVSVDGGPVTLTHQEFALLRFLAQNRGRVYSRDQLLERVWGVEYYGGSRTVDIHIRRLRMKLGSASRPIQTVRGVGYKLRAP